MRRGPAIAAALPAFPPVVGVLFALLALTAPASADVPATGPSPTAGRSTDAMVKTADADGFVPLFNGRDLAGWVPVNVASGLGRAPSPTRSRSGTA